MNKNLGRLVKTLSEKCPECFTTLQLRIRDESILVKGENLISKNEYKYCHKCEYEQEVESKIKRSKKYSKVELIENEVEKKPFKKRR